MTALLMVSNGHGEQAIAARIAQELGVLRPNVSCDHLALVGDFALPSSMREVGPRAAMPSGGLIAMLNLRNILADLRSGLIGITLEQVRLLRSLHRRYAAVVAVGDIYALGMSLLVGAPTCFVGTAKSVYVAPYGPFERQILRRARYVFVRDSATAQRLEQQRVPALAPGNVISDLYTDDDVRVQAAVNGFAPMLALFPGSRESAYEHARALTATVRELARRQPSIGGVLSLAPGLQATRFASVLANDGWQVRSGTDAPVAFELIDPSTHAVRIRAWQGSLGSLLARATLVVGQAGTANEAAAAAGVPVVALAPPGESKSAWYRRRQHGLLDGALLMLSDDRAATSAQIGALLADPAQRERMGRIGRERMGPPGGASAIARHLAAMLDEAL
ncbi:MAG: lipid-A-disaccharide synthase-related protein [Vulcanimicrobiaceae bacterium]